MDVENNEIIIDGLAMPHSPRIWNDQLYVLLSGTGELASIDIESKKINILKSLDGFVRGMDRIGDYLFIGLSKLRESSKSFQNLPVSKKSIYCGIVVIYLPQMSVAGYLKYENNVEEIYDIKVLPGIRRPNIITPDKKMDVSAITSPDSEYWAVSEKRPK